MYTKILEVEYLRTKGNDIIFPVIKDKLTYCSIDNGGYQIAMVFVVELI